MSIDLLTIQEVADALKLAERTVYTMAAEGDLPAFKLRGQWRVRRADLEKWIADKAGAAAATAPAEASVPSATVVEENRPAEDEGDEEDEELQEMEHRTRKLTQEELHDALVRALHEHVEKVRNGLKEKPLELDLRSPLPQRVRVYMYNATRPPGGRPLGEHKVQLIVPGHGRGDRGNFDNRDGRIVLLIGYAVEDDVFVLWDAGLYVDFAWSRNVQVKVETIIRASAGKLATQDRRLRPRNAPAVTETLVAASSDRLVDAIQERIRLTRERMMR